MTNPYDIEPEEPKKPSLTDKGSLLDGPGTEPCPKCGKPLAPGAVICLECGYDMRASTARKVEVGEEHAEAEPDPTVLSEPGGPGPKTLMVIGTVLAISAMVLTGMMAAKPSSATFWYIVGRIVVVAFNVLLHTGTGVVAVLLAAKLLEQKIGRLDYAAGRMFVAVSAAWLGFSVEVPVPVVGVLLKIVLAVLAYAGCVLILFKADRRDVFTIGGLHIALIMFLEIGIRITAAVANAAPPIKLPD